MNSGLKLNRYCQNSRSQNAAAGRGLTTAEYLKAYSGCCVPAHRGRMCQKSMPVVQPAGDGCGIGKSRISGSIHGEHFWSNSIREARLTGASAFLTAVSHLPKKGRMRRKDQERQRNEVDGGGRRQRYSFGKPPGLCVPGGSQARRKDATKHSGAAARAGCAKTQTQASYHGSRLRLGPIAKASCSTRHRTYLPASQGKTQEAYAGWSTVAKVQTKMESRTHLFVAGQLPQTCGAIRPKHNYLSCVFPYSLFNHNSQEVMKWLLVFRGRWITKH